MRWVACGQDASYAASLYRHLIVDDKAALTTVCGATASVPQVWRGNSTKPKCRACIEDEPCSSCGHLIRLHAHHAGCSYCDCKGRE